MSDEAEFETLEEVQRRLEAVERDLAAELGLEQIGVRSKLVDMSMAGTLKETRLVRNWNELYSAYQGCLVFQFFLDHPEYRNAP